MKIPEYRGSCVYIIWNNETDRFYIGSTVNYRKRILTHIRLLNQNKHHSWKLQYDWNRFSSWETFVLIFNTNVEHLLDDEQWCIDTQRPYYNILDQAGRGVKWTPEVREKFRRSVLSNKQHIEQCKQTCLQMAELNKIGIKVLDSANVLIGEYNSIKEASVALHIPRTSIQNVLHTGKPYKKTYKFEKWDKKS